MNDNELIVRAVEAYHEEYARIFPTGGDAQDHDEAVQAGIEVVVDLVQRETRP